jgi:hypothetical protein
MYRNLSGLKLKKTLEYVPLMRQPSCIAIFTQTYGVTRTTMKYRAILVVCEFV